jgi:NAD(P)-dependent dehydrogenase (short-subunit alcohol dehydrogenase family)
MTAPRYLLIAGTSKIAQATAEILIRAGGSVFLTGRQEAATRAAAEAVGAAGWCLCDADRFEAVEAAMTQAMDALGGLDGVAAFPGSLYLKPAHLTSEGDFDAVIAANLKPAFATVRAAGKRLAATGGSVVLMSSTAAMHGLASHEAIAAAKAGVIGLAQAAAATYAGSNLRVNVVAPGLTETPLTASLTANEASRKVSQALHPLGRLGQPEHIASAVAWLLDPANNWITGQVLAIDGGLSRVMPKMRA